MYAIGEFQYKHRRFPCKKTSNLFIFLAVYSFFFVFVFCFLFFSFFSCLLGTLIIVIFNSSANFSFFLS